MNAMVSLFSLSVFSATAAPINLNGVSIPGAPAWLTAARVQKVTDQIEDKLEWDIRKVNVTWYTDQTAFQKMHGFDGSVLAVSRAQDMSIHIGPRVESANFDGVFGHELGHIVIFQKYRSAIPKWLEEGLVNHAAKRGTIDYTWLAKHPPRDVRALSHPFVNNGISPAPGIGASEISRYHYMVSTAVVEMLAKKCDLPQLLQLAVGKSVDSFLPTFCEIRDLTGDFAKWLKSKVPNLQK